MSTDDSIRYALDGPLARITIDRPPLNVLTIGMLDALSVCFERAAADDNVRLILLRGEGKVFSAGVDVADHVGDRVEAMMDSLARLFITMDGLGKPTISVVDGPALGGGCELILATDLCFASERASFGQPEIRLGLFAPPASVLLPRLIGMRRALWMLLSGETISAPQAAALSIVNEVFPQERLDAEVDERIARLSELSGVALAHARRAAHLGVRGTVAQAHAAVNRVYLDELMQTRDAAEGLAAFTEKRDPEWTHG